MDRPGKGIEAVDEDPIRTYTPEENRRLTLNHVAIVNRIVAGEFTDRPLSIDMLRELHEALFRDVRDHAGRTRQKDFGAERLQYGPQRSEHRRDVPEKIKKALQRGERMCAELRDKKEIDGEYVQLAITAAAWTHAEVIRIHPFEDGNGRTSRMLLDLILIRAGLSPIPIEVPKQEYLDALNQFHRSSDISLVVDLLLRLYPSR